MPPPATTTLACFGKGVAAAAAAEEKLRFNTAEEKLRCAVLATRPHSVRLNGINLQLSYNFRVFRPSSSMRIATVWMSADKKIATARGRAHTHEATRV